MPAPADGIPARPGRGERARGGAPETGSICAGTGSAGQGGSGVVRQAGRAPRGGLRPSPGGGKPECRLRDRRNAAGAGSRLDGCARAEEAKVAAGALHLFRLRRELLVANAIRHLQDGGPILLEPRRWLVDGDLLAGLQVVVGEAQRVESENVASRQRVDAELQVFDQVHGALRRPGLVVDHLVGAVRGAVDAVDPAGQAEAVDPQAERLLEEERLSQVPLVEGAAQLSSAEVLQRQRLL